MQKISVIVPVYKVELYLHRCIDSILGQTFADFELILVDDGSPDNCGAICDEYARKDARVHVIHQENGGLSAARNVGIDWAFANSNSQWITFVDSDDWIHPKYLESMYAAVIKHSVKICMTVLKETDTYYVDEYADAGKSGIMLPKEAYVYKTKAIRSYACGLLYHRSCFLNIRFPKGRLWEDLAIVYKILFQETAIAVMENDLYYYFKNEDGIVRSQWNPRKLDELLAYEEQIPFFKKNNEHEIYTRLVNLYIDYINAHVKAVKKTSLLNTKGKLKYEKVLRKKLKNALKKYGKELGINMLNNPWIYACAYPRRMEIYWLLKAFESKLKRK